MKKKLLALISFSLLLSVPAHAEDIVVSVNGMVCSFCAQGIRRTLEEIEGVKSVAPDLENKRVTIVTDDTRPLTDEVVTTAIADAGYDVVKIERKKS